MKTKPSQFAICIVIVSLLSLGKIYSQGFQTKEVSDNISIVTNPDLGNQVVVQSAKGLLIFDSFWSEKTARLFKEDISKTMQRNDFSYVINMVDRLDMFGGNAAYQDAVIVGHENILTKYSNEQQVEAELSELIEMWRFKEEAARDRLQRMDKDSEQAQTDQAWMNVCKSMADELEFGFTLALPQILYKDRMTLNLGDITINLMWFGETGNYRGLSMVVIPEEKLAILNKAIIYPMLHLAPYVHPDYGVLDVPRWIALFEELLEGENAVTEIILSDDDRVYSREEWLSHLKYIRMLWESVRTADAEGMTLQEIQEQLSLDKDFAFVKEMLAYKNSSDAWIRPQHELHIKQYYLQNKTLASEILKEGGPESLQASMKKIREAGSDLYFDEMYINRIGYSWMSKGYNSEAIEVFKLNAETFPQSFNAYDSLGEVYMKIGDTKNAANNYNKSLELNPDNNNAENILEKLETK
jgi:tetratricopeptide (TPR) repeat protein